MPKDLAEKKWGNAGAALIIPTTYEKTGQKKKNSTLNCDSSRFLSWKKNYPRFDDLPFVI